MNNQTISRQKGYFLPIVGIVLVILIAGGVYYLTTLRNKQEQLQSVPVPSTKNIEQPSNNFTQEQTADWKTYKASDFSFQYPQTLTVEEQKKNYFVVTPNNKADNQLQGFVMDASLSDLLSDFDTAVSTMENKMTNFKTRNISNGLIISGKFNGEMQATTVLIRYKKGAIAVQYLTEDPLIEKIISTIVFTTSK